MRRGLLGAALGAGALTAAAVVAQRSGVKERLEARYFLFDQVRREYPGLATAAKRQQDLAPFAEALAAQPPARAQAVAELLRGADIAAMQRAMADGRLTAEELTLHYIRRIRDVDVGRLNSVVEVNPDALALARALDSERRSAGARGPLHGIPILLKDNVATGDRMRTTAGARALEGAGSDRDAFVAHRLRQAGAVLLGKANMSEWAYYMSSRGVCGYSAIGGQTHHPLGRFEVGGSSSGSAAAVGAELCAAAVGTETAGSLVYPASQHGVVTLKPSLGLVSRDRIIPITDAQDTAGPMARSVADAALLMEAMAGADPNDPITDAARDVGPGFSPGSRGLRGVRVGIVRKVVRDGDAQALRRAAAALREAGADVREATLPERVSTADVLRAGFRRGVNAYLDSVRGYAPVATLAEVIAFNRADRRTNAPYGMDLLERAEASAMTAAEYEERARANREASARAIRAALARHQVDMLLGLSNQLTGAYAPAGFPALCVPAGRRPSGEPVGATLVGDMFSDRELFGAAAALEQALTQI